MNAILEDIKESKGHKMFLLAMVGLFIAVTIWKVAPANPNTRQSTIDRAVAQFTNQ